GRGGGLWHAGSAGASGRELHWLFSFAQTTSSPPDSRSFGVRKTLRPTGLTMCYRRSHEVWAREMPDAPRGNPAASRFSYQENAPHTCVGLDRISQVLLPSSMQPVYGSAMMRPW